MRNSQKFAPIFLLLLFFTFQGIQAQTWDAGGDGTSWDDPLNWDTDMVPALGDFVDIPTSATLTMSGTGSALAPGQLRVRGATTRVYLDFDLDVGDPLSADPAILLSGGSVLTVKTGRTLIVDAAPTENAIHMNLATELHVESGSFVIVLQGRRGIQISQRLASITNDGVISLSNCFDHGILMQSETAFLNGGSLLIDSPVRAGILNRGDFINLDGDITITSPGNRGIQHEAVTLPLTSSFTNTGSGTIMISSAGDDGLQSESAFLNDTTATITITNSTDDNIELIGGTFTNHGTINITCRAGAIASGPGLAVGTNSVAATFINTSNNSLNIDGGTSTGARTIFVYSMGTLTNTGKISTSGGNAGVNVFNRGIFTNGVGGTIDMDDRRFTNQGTFVNSGYLTTTYGSGPGLNTTNGGTSTNNAFFRYSAMSDFSSTDTGNGSTFVDTGTDMNNSAETTIDFGGSCAGVLQATAIYDWMSGTEMVGTNDIAGNLTANANSIQPTMQISPALLPAVILDLVNVCALALPIELLDFKAVPNDKTVMLQWRTASEFNNDYMAVERSADGRTFEEIGRRSGVLESQVIREYELEDVRPLKGINYYRLRQVDVDGTTTFSHIISVEFSGSSAGAPSPSFYPNLVTSGSEVQLDLRSYPLDTPLDLALFDMYGRSWPLQTEVGGSVINLGLPTLPAGSYVLQVLNVPGSAPFRFVVTE